MKNIVVTGASSGIGLAVVRELVGNGYRVFGSVRKQADADRLQASLGELFSPLIFDVTDEAAIRRAAEWVQGQIGEEGLFGLVNNAGIAVFGPLMHIPLEQLRYQLEVNVTGGILGVTQAFLPMLGARENCPHAPGRIVNISSIGGKMSMPFIGPYVASKHAVEGLSNSLRRELQIYGIGVVILGPGAVKTPIWDKGVDEGIDIYGNTAFANALRKFQKFFAEEGKKGMDSSVLGSKVRKILEAKNPKTRYAIAPNMIKDWYLPRLIPHKIMDKLLGKELDLLPSKKKEKIKDSTQA